jgi:tetratricopeptide (TPR) repeat protein
MKHLCQNIALKFCVPGKLVIVLAMYALLQGCATDQPNKVDIKSVTPSVVLTAESRDDFDAAMAFVKAEEYPKAIDLLTKIVKAVPNNAVASINLALVYKQQGKLKEAEDSLKLALVAEPENPVAHNEYAMLYRKTGRFAEARKLYEKILDKYPNFNMAHKNLGILCDLYMKDFECALKHYVIYSDVNQDDKTVKTWIADLKNRAGR